ncbi:hypothetical protein GA0115240_156448 [Streptomyces sp. DvalAA-14]|uniref:hypothetical protein n=1 Tax=unclassified Streptomyces TaxID=2593676 RepID=UPI00081B3BA6|nr:MULTISPECIES: hypothetical protein [unclassified Streptomyces]MYS23819.1 hypothetical protein [Streptomyces sp. SID4948]SCE38989.1 hypothetical protein GA0115240_156448 [Streptomyces sp. DvalAA-14]
MAARYGEQLYGDWPDKGVTAPRLDAARIAGYALAVAVHLVTVLLALAGVLLIVLGRAVITQVALGAALLLAAVAMRPRLGRPLRHDVILHRAAPQCYRLSAADVGLWLHGGSADPMPRGGGPVGSVPGRRSPARTAAAAPSPRPTDRRAPAPYVTQQTSEAAAA